MNPERTFSHNDGTAPRFTLRAGDKVARLQGWDDDGDPFRLTLDRVWAGNLVEELDAWMAGE